MIQVIFISLAIVLTLFSSNTNAVTYNFPMINSKEKIYISGSIQGNEGDKNDVKLLINKTIISFIKDSKENIDNLKNYYYPIDGSKLFYENEKGKQSNSFYVATDSFEINNILRFGKYYIVDLTYNIKGNGAIRWREDLVCVDNRCYFSVAFVNKSYYQPFELAYMNYASFYNSNKPDYSIGVDIGNSFKITNYSKEFSFFTEKKENNNPLKFKIDLDKRNLVICFYKCKDESKIDKLDKHESGIFSEVKNFISGVKKVERSSDLGKYFNKSASGYEENLSFGVIEWNGEEPVVAGVDERGYAEYLSSINKIKILASIESDKKIYLLSIVETNNAGRQEEKKSQLEIITLDKGEEYRISVNPIGDYDHTLLHHYPFLKHLNRMIHDLL